MNKLPWLKPLVSVVAALAIAAGALVVGTSFAPHRTEDVATGSEVLPVLAPVAIGGEPVDPDAEDDAASPEVAEREVRLPGDSTSGFDPSVDAIVDALIESPDPASELMVLDGEAESEDAGVDDDPCAPRSGEPAADCPEGLRSTILPLIALPEFRYGVEVFPRTWEEYTTIGSRLGVMVWCDDLAVADGDIPIGLVSTVPGSFRVEFWPTAEPSHATAMVEVATPDDQRAEFEAALAGADSADDLTFPRTCFTASGLRPATDYTAEITGIDDTGRIGNPVTIRFNTAGAPVRPGLQVVPIGDNILFASAYHKPGERVETRAYAIGDSAVASCDGLPEGDRLYEQTFTDATVGADELAAGNWIPTYTRKWVVTYAVPSGANVLLCARWFPGEASRPWFRDQASYESSVIAQSPDRLIPKLELTGITGETPSPLQRMSISASTAEGGSCGFDASWAPDETPRLPMTVCDPRYLRLGGATTDGDRVWSLGFAGDLVVRARVEMDSGFSVADAVFAGVDTGCRGSCEVPAEYTYRLRLAGVNLDFRETWSLGGNGRSSWSISAPLDYAPDYVVPDVPQVDTDKEWRFSEPVIGRDDVIASYELVVDRPADYIVRFRNAEGNPAPGCTTYPSVLETRGRVTSTANVSLHGVCIGQEYLVEIELTADDGAHVVWTYDNREAYLGGNGYIQAPYFAGQVSYIVRTRAHGHVAVKELFLQVNYDGGRVENGRGGECSVDGIADARGTMDVDMAAKMIVRIRVDIEDAYGVWSDTDCADETEPAPTRTAEVEITRAQLYSLDGVRISIPELYGITVELRGVRP